MVTSGAETMRRDAPDEYIKMLSIRVNPEDATVDQINTDLNRTFPNNIYFMKEDPKCLQQPLFNVLLAFANKNPQIGYCQVRNHFNRSRLRYYKANVASTGSELHCRLAFARHQR